KQYIGQTLKSPHHSLGNYLISYCATSGLRCACAPVLSPPCPKAARYSSEMAPKGNTFGQARILLPDTVTAKLWALWLVALVFSDSELNWRLRLANTFALG